LIAVEALSATMDAFKKRPITGRKQDIDKVNDVRPDDLNGLVWGQLAWSFPPSDDAVCPGPQVQKPIISNRGVTDVHPSQSQGIIEQSGFRKCTENQRGLNTLNALLPTIVSQHPDVATTTADLVDSAVVSLETYYALPTPSARNESERLVGLTGLEPNFTFEVPYFSNPIPPRFVPEGMQAKVNEEQRTRVR
jgi:hypothetical protein